MVGDSLVVKQLKNRATWLCLSHGQATVARGVPAAMPLLSEGPGSLVREEATKSRMRNLIRICGQRSGGAFVVRLGLGRFAYPCRPTLIVLMTPRHIRARAVNATRLPERQRDRDIHERHGIRDFLDRLAELSRQRSQDGRGRSRADILRCALHDHPERGARQREDQIGKEAHAKCLYRALR